MKSNPLGLPTRCVFTSNLAVKCVQPAPGHSCKTWSIVRLPKGASKWADAAVEVYTAPRQMFPAPHADAAGGKSVNKTKIITCPAVQMEVSATPMIRTGHALSPKNKKYHMRDESKTRAQPE